MKFLLLQTFAWMVSAFFLGALLGCLAKRFLGARPARDADIPGSLATAAAGTAAVTIVKRAADGQQAPAIQAKGIPAPGMPAAPAGGLERAGSAYNYPITTVGIPRGAPEPVQPQIQKIDLTPAEKAATAGKARETEPGLAAAAAASASRPDYPITTIGIPSGRPTEGGVSYPVTTIGIPPGYTPAVAPVVVREPSQPRPEPLRPELARAAASNQAAVKPSETVAPAAPPVTVSPAAAAKPAPAAPDEQPFTPVTTSASAASALAARATTAAIKSPAASAAASASGDDLTRIRSIDETLQTRLRGAGVTRLNDIARWTPDDVNRISQALGLTSRIGAENWIEQAQILSSGGETEYSRRRQRGEITTPSTPPTSTPPTSAPPTSTAPASTTTATPAPAAETPDQRSTNVTSMAERAAAMAAAAAAAASAAAASSTPTAPLPTRLTDAIRENAAPTDSAADGSSRAPRPDLSNLRSVRSEALRGDVTAGETLRSGGPARGIGSYDDLKRIRGIGVLIEKKLNSLGVSTYEQVANWTNADIERVSQILDFKGRVERESWVEQARILASGGQTDFASRVDRGEV